MQKIYFVSKNKSKYEEVQKIISDNLSVDWYKMDIPELQTNDADVLIKRKAKDAFTEIKRPVIVEHTALVIHAFNNLPGLQTSYFYSNLGYKRIVEYCNFRGDYIASVESVFCMCDGQKYLIGKGKEEGSIVSSLAGINTKEAFDWDSIFIPEKNNPKRLTYAQQGNAKHYRSMRKQAWENLKKENWVQCSRLNNAGKNGEDITELASLIKQKKVMLFIGAGISASVGLPAWSELIGQLGEEQGYESDIFGCYGDNMMLAEYSKIKQEKKLYERICKTFKTTDEIRNKLEKSDIYNILFKLDFPVIYTTNYDHLIEDYYQIRGRGFSKIVKIDDMASAGSAIPRIMKFHGDIDEWNSIVLSESQYFERMSFQSFMDVQLQADMLQYHILFLGYSLSDINIKLLLYLAKKRWSDNKSPMKAYIYTATPNQIQKEVFADKNIVTFCGVDADKKEGTMRFLTELSNNVDIRG